MTIIKICGIKTLADGLAAIEAGADYLGFNFYPKSARFIEVQACERITTVLKAKHPSVGLVGVFVNAPLMDIQYIIETCRLDLAQLHGDEKPHVFARLAPYAYKAFRGLAEQMNDYIRYEPPAFLIDASVTGKYGGTGMTADWQIATGLARHYDFFLAGGLNPDNVAEAIRQVRPWGVDVASGVETKPGVKDVGKMKAFVEAVRLVRESCRDRQMVYMEK
jgi:phosphoribosylanthranilate isomerase